MPARPSAAKPRHKMLKFNTLTPQQLLSILLVLVLLAPAAEARSRKGDKFLALGKKAEISGDWISAFDNYDKAVAEDPGDTAYQVSYRRAKFEAAAKRIDMGQQLREEGKLEEAQMEFERAFQTDPSSAMAVQEIKRTRMMLDLERQRGSRLTAEERRMTPADMARNEVNKRVEQLQDVPTLKPVNAKVSSLKISNQRYRVLWDTLGKLTGINMIFDPELQEPSRQYSVDLANTTLEQALEHLATMTRMYWKPLSENTIFITNDNLTKRREHEEQVVKVFYLKNITSTQELNEMQIAVRGVTEVRKLFTYGPQNAIIVRGSPDTIGLTEKMIADLDKPRPEVLIDVVVLETGRGRTRELASTVVTGTTNGLRLSVTPALGGTATATSVRLPGIKDLGSSDFQVNLPSALLAAVMNDRSSKVRQTPQIRAADGQKASLRIGDRVPTAQGSFQSALGGVGGGVSPLVNTQFQYLDVGVNVDIQPKIHGDDEVSLHVELEISNVRERIDIGGIQQPVIGQRKVVHDVRLKEGEMNLIGGLVQNTESRTVSGIPGLMQIPYLGRFFSSENIERSENELMIALVPHIVRSQELVPMNLRGIATGPDQSIKLLRAPSNVEGDGLAAPTAPTAPATGDADNAPKATTPALPPAAPVNLSWQPEGVVTKQGSPVIVTLHVAGAQDLFNAPLRVKYDPKRLKFEAASSGALLTADGQRVNFSYQDNPNQGEISITLNRLPGASGIGGSGALASLNFTALTQGNSEVRVLESTLQNSKLQSVPANQPRIEVEAR